jgi:hypothetical protein
MATENRLSTKPRSSVPAAADACLPALWQLSAEISADDFSCYN